MTDKEDTAAATRANIAIIISLVALIPGAFAVFEFFDERQERLSIADYGVVATTGGAENFQNFTVWVDIENRSTRGVTLSDWRISIVDRPNSDDFLTCPPNPVAPSLAIPPSGLEQIRFVCAQYLPDLAEELQLGQGVSVSYGAFDVDPNDIEVGTEIAARVRIETTHDTVYHIGWFPIFFR